MSLPYYGALGALGAYGLYRGYKRISKWRASRRPPVRRYRRFGRGSRRGRFASRVRSIIQNGAEKKFHDLAFTGTGPVSGSSDITHLTDIDEGDTNQTREGERIKIKSIQIQGTLTSDGAAAAQTTCRLLVIQAKTNIEGAAPVIGDFLMADTVNDLYQIDNKGDIKVWVDQKFTISTDGTKNMVKCVRHYIPFKGSSMPCVWYDGTGGGIADAEKGHWFLVAMTSLATDDQPTWSIKCRVKFIDV